MISVIIPVYNTEKYLRQCLDSVLNQTYRDLEILVIDDGSTDRSSQICDSYSEKDNRVQVWHRENRGVSESRNFGLRNSSGEWVSFVDSDDWLNENMFQTMVDMAEKYHADTVCCGHYNCRPERTSVARTWRFFETEDFVCEKDALFTDILCRAPYLWDILLNGKKARDISFENHVRYGEDLLFLTQYLLEVNKVAGTKLPLYNYREEREGGTVSAAINETYLDYIKAAEKTVDMLNPQGEYYAGVIIAVRVIIKVLRRVPVRNINTYQAYVEEVKRLAEKVKPVESVLLKTKKNMNNVARKTLLAAARRTSRFAVIIAKMINRVQER